MVRRSKPFKYTYEKEIVMYAYFKKLDYFSTECIYSPNAYRGYARTFLKDLEAIRPSAIIGKSLNLYWVAVIANDWQAVLIDIIHSGEAFEIKTGVKMPEQQTCTRCGYISSNELCKACILLDGLNRGLPRLGITREQRTVCIVSDGIEYRTILNRMNRLAKWSS
jgi:cytoplasmic tRNA 2-thiolation protein 1